SPTEEHVRIARDLSFLARASPSGEIRILSVSDGRTLFRLPGPSQPASYTFIRMDRDGKHLGARHEIAAASRWRLWDLERRVPSAEVEDASSANCIDFSPDGRWAAVGTNAGGLRLIDSETGATMKEVASGSKPRGVAVHPGGRLIALSSDATQ